MLEKDKIEIWGYNTYRPLRIFWILNEYELDYKSYKIGSRTGETQTAKYLQMNPKGKIPCFKHNNIIITESFAATNYIVNEFKKPDDFFLPTSAHEKAKLDEWCAFSLMELDCLGIYTLRKHELPNNFGLSNLYGEAPNAINAARIHFDKMIKACEKDVPKNQWLLGESPSVADIIFISCLMPCEKFNIEIKSDNVALYFERAQKRMQFLKAHKECFEK